MTRPVKCLLCADGNEMGTAECVAHFQWVHPREWAKFLERQSKRQDLERTATETETMGEPTERT